ncbi:uncharacterized protein SPSK_07973 [Sporothrix schenckii 1099-18]|uniref:Dihydroceramidase n=1 Tax=Sporothrix schenckii 1099-18 TaxID=1397361 RepID=A0A0F2MER4_SPOSC|nr:uncharacterized protein SPSK_07973 [Sporothrix schenckii 1099-18]KJR88122.1 hypothetical protein SPSK_07973 [Sporothrix schenckii 1099-18]
MARPHIYLVQLTSQIHPYFQREISPREREQRAVARTRLHQAVEEDQQIPSGWDTTTSALSFLCFVETTIAFATVLALIVLRGHYLFHWRVGAFPPHKLADWRVRGRKALILLLVGYGLWNIDRELCAQLRSVRAKMGLPWAWLLELHGWWHVLTAISADMAMSLVRDVRSELSSSDNDRGVNEDKSK